MRCSTCSETSHPGYVAWREIDLGDGLFRRSLVLCPDCGGLVTIPDSDGSPSGHRDAAKVRELSSAMAWREVNPTDMET
jgi:hypothetical protein